MARDSIRSVRRGAAAVALLGVLSLAVPLALLVDDEHVPGPALSYGGERAADYNASGQQPAATVNSPARAVDVVLTGFSPYELVLLQLSGFSTAFDHTQADADGVVHYRFTVPPLLSGTHVLWGLGTRSAARTDGAVTPSGRHLASYAFTVPG